MSDFIELTTDDSERMTCEMPRDQNRVEVRLADGSIHSAIFEIYGYDDWWFGRVDADGEPTEELGFHNVIAWRYPQKEIAKAAIDAPLLREGE